MALFDWFPKTKSGAPQNKPALDDIARRLAELESRVDSIDQRILRLEEQAHATLEHFGRYATRTKAELNLMRDQVEDLIASTEAILQHVEDQSYIMRGRQLLRRLKNNHTRIRKALVA